jgi:CBS domain containing-hemolysin-like protein
VLALVASVLLLALNAFFVAAEFALVKVRVTKLEPRARRGERRAVAAKAVLGRLDRYLSVTQFGITVASLGLGWIGEPAIERLLDHGAVALTGEPLGDAGRVVVPVVGLSVLTFLHLLVGELVPKFIAIQYSEATALNAAIPLRLVNAVFRPVLFVLEKSQRVVLRALRINPDIASEGAMSEEEIVGILAANAARDPAARDKQRLLERVLRFTHRPVRNVMVPRVDMVALDIDATGEQAFAFLSEHEFSRVPLVVGGNLDEVVGYLYVKDFLFDPGARARSTLRGLERQALFVSETRDGLAVLRDLQTARIPLALVVDEYGGTSGLVTLEDLVEEIVGEIRDETDVEPDRIAPSPGDPRSWVVDARTTTDELRDRGIPLAPGIDGEGEALGKLVVARLGRLPRIGDVVALAEGVVAEVVATTRRRVQRVRVHVEKPPMGEPTADAPA